MTERDRDHNSERDGELPPHHASVDDLVAKGRTLIERARRAIDRMTTAWKRR